MDAYLTAAALAFVALAYALDRFGYLPRRRSASDAAAELNIADHTSGRLRRERDEARARVATLEATRSLEPIIEQLHANAELQAAVLDRLSHHNGSFRHMEESLQQLAEGLKLVTGFIAGLVDLPLKNPPA